MLRKLLLQGKITPEKVLVIGRGPAAWGCPAAAEEVPQQFCEPWGWGVSGGAERAVQCEQDSVTEAAMCGAPRARLPSVRRLQKFYCAFSRGTKQTERNKFRSRFLSQSFVRGKAINGMR